MVPIFFSHLFDLYKSVDLFVNQETDDFEIEETASKNLKFYLTDENIKNPVIEDIFTNLFEILGVTEDEYPTNYAQIIFDAESYEHKYTGYPSIGINSNQELVLRIGNTSAVDEQVCLDIPLFWNGKEYFLKMLNREKMVKLDIQAIIQNQGKPDQKTTYYISGKAEIGKPKYTFMIPFKIKENTTDDVLTDAWYSGQFELVVSPFNLSGINLSKAFANCLEDGSFPSGGILLVLKDGYRDSFYDSVNDKTYISSKWRIAACSHPNLLVESYSDGLVPLSTVGQISASSSSSATKFLLSTWEMAKKPENFSIPMYIMHITGVNMQGNKPRLDWQPKNNGFLSINTISPLAKRQFKGFLQETKPLIDSLSAKGRVSIPVSGNSALELEPELDEKPF